MTTEQINEGINSGKWELIATENGRISHGQTEYREAYKLEDGRILNVTCDQALNHDVTEWSITETLPAIWR